MKIANWPLLMVLAVGCGGELEEEDLATDEAAINGFGSASVNPFTVGVVRIEVGAATCTGTLVNRYYALTSRSCVSSQAASSITVTLPNSTAGTAATSTVRWTITEPAFDLTLLYLNSAIVPANRDVFPPILATLPPNSSSSRPSIVTCNGYGTGSLRNGPFAVGNGAGAGFELFSGSLVVEPGDLGGPCFDAQGNIAGFMRSVSTQSLNARAIAGVGVSGTTMDGAAATTSVQQWVNDMIHLSNLRPGRYSYTYINRHSDKALDVAWGNYLPGEAVNQIQRNGGLNQNWYEEYTDYPFMRLVSARSGKCLDVNAASKLTQNSCNDSPSQKWRAIYRDNTFFALVSAASGCADIPGFSTSNGTRVQKYACNGGTNQQFYRQLH